MQQEPSKRGPPTPVRKLPSASAPHAIRTRGREQDMLEMFIGSWQVRGYNEPSAPQAGRASVTGTQEFHWLPGEFFLRGSWQHRFGERSHRGVSIVGFEPEHGLYFAHHYDNLGYFRSYTLDLIGRTWTVTGQFE